MYMVDRQAGQSWQPGVITFVVPIFICLECTYDIHRVSACTSLRPANLEDTYCRVVSCWVAATRT